MALLVDIGGGSVEISLGNKGGILSTQSHAIGSVRLLRILDQRRMNDQRFNQLVNRYVDVTKQRLKKELGPNLWVMGYANDVMAYIPSARVLKEGGYEGGGAMVYYGLPTVWGLKVEELIVEEVARQVKQLRGK